MSNLTLIKRIKNINFYNFIFFEIILSLVHVKLIVMTPIILINILSLGLIGQNLNSFHRTANET